MTLALVAELVGALLAGAAGGFGLAARIRPQSAVVARSDATPRPRIRGDADAGKGIPDSQRTDREEGIWSKSLSDQP